MRRPLRFLLIASLTLAFLIGAGMGGIWLVLGTEAGRVWLGRELAGLASGPGRVVTIGRIDGALPFHPRIAMLEIADADGIWLRARNLTLDVSAPALLERRLDIDRFDAEDIMVLRKPVATAAVSTGPSAFVVPQPPLPVSLRQLRLQRLTLAAPVLGKPVVIGLSGSGVLSQGRAELSAALDRLDGQPGSARVALSYGSGSGAVEHLDLAILASDPSGLLVKTIDPGAGALPLNVAIHGGGPVEAWRGTMTASAGPDARIASTLGLDRDKAGLAIALHGRATLGTLLPTRFRAAVGEGLSLDAVVRVPDRGSVAISTLDVRTSTGTVTLQGDLGLPKGVTKLSLRGELALAPLSDLAGSKLGGSASIVGELTGSKAAPLLTARLMTRGLRVANTAIETSDTRITIDGYDAATAHGSVFGEIGGISVPAPNLPRRLTDDVLWSAEFLAGGGETLLNIRRAHIDDSVVHADLDGQYGGKTGRATIRIAADDLAALAPASVAGLRGRAFLQTQFDLRPDGTLHAATRASADSMRFGVPALDALIGGKLELVATAERAKNGAIKLSEISAIGSDVRAAGKATLDANDSDLSANGTLTLPRLAPLSAAIGGKLAGSAVLNATASGSIRAPRLEARLETSGLRLNDRVVDRLVLTAATTPQRSKAVDLRLDLAVAGLDEIAMTTLSWQGLPQINVSGLVLAGTAAQGRGNFVYDTSDRRLLGRFNGGVQELGSWSGLLGTEISGRADLAIAATAEGGQGITGRLHAQDFALGPSRAPTRFQDATIDIAVGNLLHRPQGRVSARLTNGRLGTFRLASAHLDANRGGGPDIAIAAGITGAFREPVTLESTGSVSGLDRDPQLVLASLSGRLGSQLVQLRQPFRLSRRGGGVGIGRLDLALGSGQITASGTADRIQGAVTLAARQIDLAPLARLFGQDEISGVLGADGHVSGPWVRPDGQLKISVPALKLAAASHPELPALAANLAMTLRNQSLAVDGRIETLGHESIGLKGRVPLVIAPGAAPFVSSPGRVDLTVAGEGRLEDVAAILPLGEDQIGGIFRVNLRVGGTLDTPRADGGISISQGRYDNLATGVTLRNLGLELVGNEAALELRRLDATDADSGHISGAGRIALDGAGGPGLDLALSMTRFVVTRLDTATVTASGKASVTGPISSPHISGKIGIDRADIQIPDKLPSQIPTVAVIRVNSLHPQTETPPPILPAVVASLDVTVTAPDKIFISGQGLTSEWQGKVAATGTSDSPNLVGRIIGIRGTYAILGKTFTLQRGVITFAGGGAVDPALDIQAERIATDITARIAIAGTVSTPGLTLTSTPALPQDEILSRVLFGTGVGQITTLQALQLAQTAAAFTGNGPDVMSKVRGIVGLDQLTLDSDPTAKTPANKTALGNTTINGGKYIAPGVFVGVQKGLTPSATKGQIQITVSPHVSVEGAIGAGSSSSSLGLAYRRDY